MKNENKKGFTLVELIVVVAIIGALAAILVPTIYKYVRDARIAAAVADAKTIKTAVEASLARHILLNDGDTGSAFNKVLYYDKDTNKNWKDRNYEQVGTFTNYSWYVYKTNGAASGSQALDKVIAGALENAFTEDWKTGSKPVVTLGYNTKTKNCKKLLKDIDSNFGIVVVYNMDGTVRLLQIYRKSILVTYINGDFLTNTSSDAHFVGSGTWSTIYADSDSGESAPQEMYTINLSNGQIKDGQLKGWF